jgi:hypothetical protein
VRNPWLQLPERPPYVLADDQALVDVFNRNASVDHAIHVKHLPEPFLGRPDAPLVVLGLNPGHNPLDYRWHIEPEFVRRSRANLVHGKLEYPFYLLDPALQPPGNRWWTRKFRRLIEATDLESVARSVLCVEYFPYHSKRFGHRRLKLASQGYSYWLVEQAMERDAVIVMMRSKKLWFGAIPALASYARLHHTRSVQNPTISSRNLPAGFAEVVQAIRNAPR